MHSILTYSNNIYNLCVYTYLVVFCSECIQIAKRLWTRCREFCWLIRLLAPRLLHLVSSLFSLEELLSDNNNNGVSC